METNFSKFVNKENEVKLPNPESYIVGMAEVLLEDSKNGRLSKTGESYVGMLFDNVYMARVNIFNPDSYVEYLDWILDTFKFNLLNNGSTTIDELSLIKELIVKVKERFEFKFNKLDMKVELIKIIDTMLEVVIENNIDSILDGYGEKLLRIVSEYETRDEVVEILWNELDGYYRD